MGVTVELVVVMLVGVAVAEALAVAVLVGAPPLSTQLNKGVQLWVLAPPAALQPVPALLAVLAALELLVALTGALVEPLGVLAAAAVAAAGPLLCFGKEKK